MTESESWNLDKEFLFYIGVISLNLDKPQFDVKGKKRTLRDLINGMAVGTDWGKAVYAPLYQAYTGNGPLAEGYRAWLEERRTFLNEILANI